MNRFYCKAKKIIINLLIIVLVFSVFQIDVQAASYIKKNGISVIKLDSEEVKGKLNIQGETSHEKIKILIKKGEVQRWYEVEIDEGAFEEEIWLIDGQGTYDINIMVHKGNRKYSYGPKLKVKNTEDVNRFLVPTKHVESNDKKVIELAKKITENKDKDIDKAKAIYDWVVKNIKYDFDKYTNQVNNNYDNDYGAVNTLETSKGVCYDYAALTAALGRAVGMQVKVVNGEGISGSFKGFHAWNEVYISEEEKWINVDTSFAVTVGKDYFNSEDFSESHLKADEY